VAVFIEFIRAYNAGQLQSELALLAEDMSVSDCDYENIKVITFQGKSQVAEWLQQRISDHDQLEISHIYNENPDPSSSSMSSESRMHLVQVQLSRDWDSVMESRQR
jgi:hypothetical protein